MVYNFYSTEAYMIAKEESLLELDDHESEEGKIADDVLAAVIAASIAIAFIMFIVLCALNYMFFYYYTKNNKIDAFPTSSLCGNTNTEFKRRSSCPGILNSHQNSAGAVSRSYPKGWSKSTVQSSKRMGMEIDSCDCLPPIAVHAASSPGSFRNDSIYRSIIKDSKCSMQPHRGSLDSSLDSKGLIKKYSSLPIVTPEDLDDVPERISETPIVIKVDGIGHTEEDYHFQMHPEITLSSTIISESVSETIEPSEKQNDNMMADLRTGLSGSLAETSINLSSSSKETTGITQRRILESVKMEDTLKSTQKPTENKGEKKASALFEVVPLELHLNPVKPYFSSNMVPESTMLVVCLKVII